MKLYVRSPKKRLSAQHIVFGLLFVFLSLSNQILAAPYDHVTVGMDFNDSDLTPYLNYIQDKKSSGDIDAVLDKSNWSSIDRKNISFGFTKGDWYFRFKTFNTTASWQDVILKIDNPLLDKIEVFKIMNESAKSLRITGDLLPSDSRDVKSHTFSFLLGLSPGENQFLFKINTSGALHLFPRLVSKHQHLEDEVKDYSRMFFLLAWMCLILIYNLFIYAALRQKEILFFIGFVFSLFFYRLTALGFSALYIFPPSISDTVVMLTTALANIFGSYFFQLFFITRQDFKRTHQLINWGSKYPSALLCVLSPILPHNYVMIPLNLISLMAAIIALVLTVRAAIRRLRPAYFILIGFGVFFIMVPIQVLYLFGMLSQTVIINLTYDLGLGWLMLFSSLGVTDGLNKMAKNLRRRRDIIESTSAAICTTDVDGNIDYVNQSFLDLWGYSSLTEVVHVPMESFWVNDPRGLNVADALKVNQKWFGEIEGKKKNGEVFCAQVSATHIYDKQERVQGDVISVFDVSQRRLAEKALSESEWKYKSVIENANEAIVVLQNGFITFLNPKVVDLSGYTEAELMSRHFIELVHPEDQNTVSKKYIRRLKGLEIDEIYAFRVIGKDDEIKWCEIKPVVISWEDQPAMLCFLNDVTERKKTQELMIQSEKMMSIGRLAAGTAHELNNPLAGMIQGTQNVKRRLLDDLPANLRTAKENDIDLDKVRKYLEARQIPGFINGILESGTRATHIITNMLSFSRKSESKFAPIQLEQLLDTTLELANKDYDFKKRYDFKSVEIVKEFDPDLPPVPCTETEIEQVILNLISNAVWAMNNSPNVSEKKITLRLRVKNEQAIIEVEDTGPGMDPKTQKKIFDPFYTTKPVGEGTGLGLSVSYMIITGNHSGTMEVISQEGKGTLFSIKLPVNRHYENAT